MKFHTLDVQNFLTLKSASINLEDQGLHLIQGVNDDDSSATSNGAGKSSLVDAICWVLFGLTAREVKGDSVVNLAAKKDCRVSLVMSNGHTRYRAIRHRKHGTFKNSLIVEVASADPSVEPTDLSRGTDAETQKVLEGILGCTYEVFMAAVYSGQEVMPDLPKMKDRELKTLIEEAAGMQRIERAYEAARERNNELKLKTTAASNQLSAALANKATLDHRLEQAQELTDKWEDSRTARIVESETRQMEASDALTHATNYLTKALPDKDRAVAAIVKIDIELKNHKALADAAAIAERAVRTAEMAIDASALKRLQAEVQRHADKIANAAFEIKKPCTECGTVLETMPLGKFIEHAEAHLAVARVKLADAKALAVKQMEEVKSARATAATMRAAVPDVTTLVSDRAGCQTIIDNYSLIEGKVRLAALNSKAADEQLALRKAEPNPNTVALDLAKSAVVEAVAKVGATQTALDAVEKEAKVSAAVVKVFGPAGVRAQILDSVTPFLNDRTADYLSALSDGEITATWTTLTKSAAGELKEKFSLDVTHAKGGDSFIALSGGEKRKVRLATALALQDLVASRATQPIDLWVGDEVDDALDPAGLERLMTILERKARERGTVLVISHSDLRDWIDNVTTVRKEALWSSTVEGSLVCS